MGDEPQLKEPAFLLWVVSMSVSCSKSRHCLCPPSLSAILPFVPEGETISFKAIHDTKYPYNECLRQRTVSTLLRRHAETREL